MGLGIKDGRAAHGLQFGQRQRTGTGNDQICGGQQLGHIVDVGRDNQVLTGGKALFFQLIEQLYAAAAGGMQVQHVRPLLLFPGAEVRHHLVDAVSAQARRQSSG